MTAQASDIVKLVSAIADTATVAVDTIRKGHPTILDIITKGPAVLKVLQEFGTIDYKSLIPEAEKLSSEDITAIVAAFNGSLNIQAPTVEAAIEAGFASVLKVAGLIKSLVEEFTRIKGLVTPAVAPAVAPAA